MPASAQDPGLQAGFGMKGYRLFCAGCHGPDGKGNPELSQALEMPLVDLTKIAERNGGTFPSREVAAAIAGESKVIVGHRALAVSPWAQTFAREFENFAPPPAIEDLVQRRIDHIVAYLKSIQE